MKVLVIGGGGREHAIAWRLAQERGVEVFATPGNPGIATLGQCLAPPASTPEGYLTIADQISADLTVVGPEAPLVAGTADLFRARGRRIFGPSKAAAELEGSKAFAKQAMVEAGVPTAAYRRVTTLEEADDALRHFGYPVAIKADGLAAGKGVILAESPDEAHAAVRSLRASIGPLLIIEEYLHGEEASFIAICDGHHALPLEASQDHKRIFDDDRGPNTGGMGAYTDGRILTLAETQHALDVVIQPVLNYMRGRGTPFVGFLYAGLMMTGHGPKVLEFNVRLGDPETQSLLHRIDSGFADALVAAADGDLASARLTWKNEPSVCVVVAAHGYPDTPRTGDVITGIATAESTGATVFHAGTRATARGIETAGGRVIGVTHRGPTLPDAIDNVYAALAHIHFDGMQFRHDIGRKGLKRWGRIKKAGGRSSDG